MNCIEEAVEYVGWLILLSRLIIFILVAGVIQLIVRLTGQTVDNYQTEPPVGLLIYLALSFI